MTESEIQDTPIKDESSIDGLRGLLADCPEMSVDKFLARMREDAKLDL